LLFYPVFGGGGNPSGWLAGWQIVRTTGWLMVLPSVIHSSRALQVEVDCVDKATREENKNPTMPYHVPNRPRVSPRNDFPAEVLPSKRPKYPQRRLLHGPRPVVEWREKC